MAGAYKAPKERELRAQGKRTLRRLLGAGLQVFADRGYHAARVDDIVRVAETSHGTFYLYFTSKEHMLGALAAECAAQYEQLAAEVDEIDKFVARFFEIYQQYGPVIRAWMERHVTAAEVNRLGVDAFTHIAAALAKRLQAVGAPHDMPTVGAMMALLERSAYYQSAGAMPEDAAPAVAGVLKRGFLVPS